MASPAKQGSVSCVSRPPPPVSHLPPPLPPHHKGSYRVATAFRRALGCSWLHW